MSKNTVARTSAPDTTEGTKRRNAKIAAKAAVEERERNRTYIGAHGGRSVPVMTREQYMELVSGRGGNGDPDAMLGERMNPLVVAAGGTSPVAVTAMTVPAVLQVRKDIKELGVNITDNPDAMFNLAMLGMVIRGSSLNPKSVSKANKMLGGRIWEDLPRAEKLRIKKETGLEKVSRGLGDWVQETPTDPVMRKGLEQRLVEWGRDFHGRGPRPNEYGGGLLGPYDQVMKDNGSGYLKYLGEKAYETDVRVINSERSLRGASGEYDPIANEVRITERATELKPDPIESLRELVTHEGVHIGQNTSPKEFMIPYGSRPSEIEAHAVAARSKMSPEERAGSLIEDSHPALESWGKDFYDDAAIDQAPLRETSQDAKGGQSADVRAATDRGNTNAVETFDTQIPDNLRPKYEAWYAQLPKNLQYTGDYDLQGAWLEKLGRPEKYEAAQNGHLDDYGKKPNHITFSNGSKWHDPKVPERTGGTWKQAKDGSWDFYPGAGNKATDEELAKYFAEYEKGSRVHRRDEVRQAAKGGDGGNETGQVEAPVQGPGQAVSDGGPRIAVNPAVFHDKRDALCVALNEAFRVIMEMNGFEPVSEPTDRQREFFSDTAYGDDELMLRRTILARICTFDTSVADPTDEQLQEAVEFLETVMEIGAPQNEWEQSVVQRIRDVLKASIGMPRKEREPENPAPKDAGAGTQAAVGSDESDAEVLAPAAQPAAAQPAAAQPAAQEKPWHRMTWQERRDASAAEFRDRNGAASRETRPAAGNGFAAEADLESRRLKEGLEYDAARGLWKRNGAYVSGTQMKAWNLM